VESIPEWARPTLYSQAVMHVRLKKSGKVGRAAEATREERRIRTAIVMA